MASPSAVQAAGWFGLGRWQVNRVGYGAIQLAGDNVFGPPRDRDEALRVLRATVDSGINHLDTAQYYGPGVVNELIRKALHPYPDDLAIVSKVAARRDETGAVLPLDDPDQLRAGIEENLLTLGADRLAAVNLRLMDGSPPNERFDAQLAALVRARDDGLIDGIGLSNISAAHLRRALDRPISSASRTCSTSPINDRSTSSRTVRPGALRSCRSARWAGPGTSRTPSSPAPSSPA
ncbi:MAG: putative oxidoreductase, aryl-alcohol dehydrogenase like protein [Frankiales bacterium]|nr:putative oxidoreductase, aryl-alcohol dehydrogenase like protein [Frankiales bacterium]